MDSVTLLYDLVSKGLKLEALSFDYGSKHNHKEIPLAKYHCKKLNVNHRIIKLEFNKFMKSDLLKSGGKIPEGHYEDKSMKKTVVPFRNGIMLSLAVGYAESIGAKKVFLGSHQGDRAIYPDCRTEFTKAMSEASRLGTYNKIVIVSPYNNLMKWDIVKRGLKLNVPYNKTWSCYKGGNVACGKCGTCVERLEAFEKNNVKDSVKYQ